MTSSAHLPPAKGGVRVDPAQLISALPSPVVLLGAGNSFLYANPAAEQFLGISSAQLLQMSLSDLLAPDQPLFALLAQIRAQSISVANHDLTLDGPRLHKTGIAVHGALLTDQPDCVLLSFHDGSAARVLDRQMSFQGTARTIGGMAALLAHEIKNPLSGIRGASQLLEASVSDADRDLTVLIRDETDRICALVDRMGIFGEKPVEFTPVNIHRVLDHVRLLAKSGFADGLEITERYDPSLPSVWGNRDQLVQVLLNLVKNAAEAINQRPEGEITLTTAFRHGPRMAVPGATQRVHLPLLVSVRDNGPGVPEDLKPHLFEPFVTSKASGTGLGLALVAKIVADHGGIVQVDSEPGCTEIRLLLPMCSDEAV